MLVILNPRYSTSFSANEHFDGLSLSPANTKRDNQYLVYVFHMFFKMEEKIRTSSMYTRHSLVVTLFTFFKSVQKRYLTVPSGNFFLTNRTGERHGLLLGLKNVFLSISSICCSISSLATEGIRYCFC